MFERIVVECQLKGGLFCKIADPHLNKFCIYPYIDKDIYDSFCLKNNYKDPRNRPDTPMLIYSYERVERDSRCDHHRRQDV